MLVVQHGVLKTEITLSYDFPEVLTVCFLTTKTMSEMTLFDRSEIKYLLGLQHYTSMITSWPICQNPSTVNERQTR